MILLNIVVANSATLTCTCTLRDVILSLWQGAHGPDGQLYLLLPPLLPAVHHPHPAALRGLQVRFHLFISLDFHIHFYF